MTTKPSHPLLKAETRPVRVYAEIVRRKGLSVADAQRLPGPSALVRRARLERA